MLAVLAAREDLARSYLAKSVLVIALFLRTCFAHFCCLEFDYWECERGLAAVIESPALQPEARNCLDFGVPEFPPLLALDDRVRCRVLWPECLRAVS